MKGKKEYDLKANLGEDNKPSPHIKPSREPLQTTLHLSSLPSQLTNTNWSLLSVYKTPHFAICNGMAHADSIHPPHQSISGAHEDLDKDIYVLKSV